LQVGASLYDGWHEGASGSSDENMEFVIPYAIEQNKEDASIVSLGGRMESTYEWRLNRRLQNAAIDWALRNSSDAGRLGLVKFLKTWSPFPVAKEIGGRAVKWTEAIGYTTIMALAAMGLWHTRKFPGAWLVALPCVYFAALHVFFIGSVRYRQPAVLAMCVLGGIGFVALVNRVCLRNGAPASLEGSIAPINGNAERRQD
jgi:hypothetical protein